MNDEALEELGIAVVERSVKDYRLACRAIKKCHKESDRYFEALIMKAECERFFRSQYFNVFSAIDGKALLERLRKECE